MKHPNHQRLSALTAVAVVLAFTSTGFLFKCDPDPESKPQQGPPMTGRVTAGGTVTITNSFDPWGLIAACAFIQDGKQPSTVAPAGVHLRTDRNFLGSEPSASVDVITSSATPPGHYLIEYRQASLGGGTVVGTIDLTVDEAVHGVTACLYVYAEGEVILVNQPVNFYACCSFSPENDPIVEYQWWFNYNGNPSSAPSRTTGGCMTNFTYTTTGVKHTRLVVRTQSGEEAEDTQDITVMSP